MTRKQQEKLLNDFLHQLVVYKSIKIQKPICSNTIAECVIDYLDLKEIKHYLYKGANSPFESFKPKAVYESNYKLDKFSRTVKELVELYLEEWELINS